MRPRGELRAVLTQTYAELGPSTVHAVCLRAQVGYMDGRRTVENMARAGELVRCGAEKPAGSGVWRAVYELAEPEPVPEPTATQLEQLDALAAVTAGWASFV